MATYEQGINNISKTLSTSPLSILGNDILLNANLLQLVKVVDVVLDSSHPKFSDVGEYSGIGAVYYTTALNSTSNSTDTFALPYDSTLKQYPLIDEFILIINLSNRISISSPRVYYLKPLSLFNTLNNNAYPSISPSTPSSQNSNYVNGITSTPPPPKSLKPRLNSSTSITPNPFIEQDNIRTLSPNPGDVIIEGRNGQSIRFSNQNGNPITLLRNGQDRTITPTDFNTIEENIKNDLSSIYLTSTQKINNLSLVNEKFVSYSTKPVPLNEYNEPQIVLNSNRITIEAETDSIFLSSQKSIGLLSNESINIESKDINIHTDNRIRLGSKNATESVLLGDKTYDILEFLLNCISQISDTLTPDQLYPSGIPIPDAPKTANSLVIKQAVETVKAELLPNIKSNVVKVE